LRPPALDELGLAKTLTSFSDGWRDGTGTPVELVLAGVDEPRLPNAIETTIYRVIQEAMNNVHKHAHATNVSVSVARRGDSLVAIVEDDGRGFDVSELEQLPLESAKIGIVGMRERAQLVNGELVVESSPGSGTTVRLKLRVPPASEPH
jgi:signal transduction histidine kinase